MAVPADILVPAAMSSVIPLEAVDRIQARMIVEGPNLPTLPEAGGRTGRAGGARGAGLPGKSRYQCMVVLR